MYPYTKCSYRVKNKVSSKFCQGALSMIIFLGNFCRLTRLFKIVNQRLLCLYLLQQVKTYTKLLDPLLVRDDAGLPLVPEFFYVPRNKVFLNLFLFIYQFTNDLMY